MSYFIWIPLTFIITSVATYSSYKLNLNPKNIYWFITCWIFFSTPLWTFVARKSKNITIDGLIYDGIMVMTFVILSSYLLSRDNFIFSNYQITGIILMIISIFLLKIG